MQINFLCLFVYLLGVLCNMMAASIMLGRTFPWHLTVRLHIAGKKASMSWTLRSSKIITRGLTTLLAVLTSIEQEGPRIANLTENQTSFIGFRIIVFCHFWFILCFQTTGGVEPSIRKEVWQFLFGLYPCTSTARWVMWHWWGEELQLSVSRHVLLWVGRNACLCEAAAYRYDYLFCHFT